MELTCFHKYIGGNICSKITKLLVFLNRQCAAILAAPIMDHDVIVTLFDVYSFGALFHSNTEESHIIPADYLCCMV